MKLAFKVAMKKKRKSKFSVINMSLKWHVGLSLLLLVLSIVYVKIYNIPQWEITVFNSIYSWPSFLRPLFFIVTQTGSVLVLGAILLFYLVASKYHILIRFLLTGLTAYLLSGVAKDLWGRARPLDVLDNIVNLDYVVRGPGFPSGHTALATALALTMGHHIPKRYHYIIWVWIIGVGLSRIFLGIHFPMDIIGGFAIGWLSYALFMNVRIYDKTFKKSKKSSKSKLKK